MRQLVLCPTYRKSVRAEREKKTVKSKLYLWRTNPDGEKPEAAAHRVKKPSKKSMSGQAV